MKLYKRKDFLLLPENTVYSRVWDAYYSTITGLYVKTSNLPDDFMYQDLISEDADPLDLQDWIDIMDHAQRLRDNLQDFRMDLTCERRDGMFNDDDVFVVWDKEDITRLRDYLNKCL